MDINTFFQAGFANFSWLAAGTSLILAMALGMLWYGGLFSKAWMNATGIKDKDPEQGKLIAMEIINSAIRVVALGIFASMSMFQDFWMILVFAAVLSLASAVSMEAQNKIWEKRTWGLWAINSSHAFVDAVMILSVMTYFPW